MEDIIRLPLNKLVYESLEDILDYQIKKLAKDIAKTLNVDPKLLLIELKKEKILAYVIEEDYVDIDSMKCKYYDKKENIYIPCEEPVIFKKDYCVHHINYGITKEKIPKDSIELTILKLNSILYYKDSSNRVFNSSFIPIGEFDSHTNILYEFTIENENESNNI